MSQKYFLINRFSLSISKGSDSNTGQVPMLPLCRPWSKPWNPRIGFEPIWNQAHMKRIWSKFKHKEDQKLPQRGRSQHLGATACLYHPHLQQAARHVCYQWMTTDPSKSLRVCFLRCFRVFSQSQVASRDQTLVDAANSFHQLRTEERWMEISRLESANCAVHYLNSVGLVREDGQGDVPFCGAPGSRSVQRAMHDSVWDVYVVMFCSWECINWRRNWVEVGRSQISNSEPFVGEKTKVNKAELATLNWAELPCFVWKWRR